MSYIFNYTFTVIHFNSIAVLILILQLKKTKCYLNFIFFLFVINNNAIAFIIIDCNIQYDVTVCFIYFSCNYTLLHEHCKYFICRTCFELCKFYIFGGGRNVKGWSSMFKLIDGGNAPFKLCKEHARLEMQIRLGHNSYENVNEFTMNSYDIYDI